MSRTRAEFRLPPATLTQLDAIARRLPRRGRDMPATRTDAVVVATQETYDRMAKQDAERREGE